MKINKKKLMEAKLTEENEDSVASSEEEKQGNIDTLTATDPSSDSVSEIADAVKAGVELASDGTQTVSDAEAKNVAKDIKEIGNDLGIDKLTAVGPTNDIETVNTLTKALDDALAKTWEIRDDGDIDYNTNVLVTGLPGSGKTAIVKSWCRRNGLNYFYLDAKNPDLEIIVNGMPMRDLNSEDKNKLMMAPSNILDPLKRENSVLFLDELNRQTKENIRGSLYTLIQERRVVGKNADGSENEDGTVFYPNLLFCIACINPSTRFDKGATPFTSAEKSRFAKKTRYDSNPEGTADFIEKFYNKKIERLGNPLESTEKTKRYIRFSKLRDLGLYLVTDPDFAFDTLDDEEDLSLNQLTPLNTRYLTDILRMSSGNKDNFIERIECAELLQRDVDMIKKILSSYAEKPDSVYVSELQAELGLGDKNTSTAAATKTPVNIEDDEDFFHQAASGKVAVTPNEVESRVSDAVDGWF